MTLTVSVVRDRAHGDRTRARGWLWFRVSVQYFFFETVRIDMCSCVRVCTRTYEGTFVPSKVTYSTYMHI